jgi:competence protein ComEA
MSTGLAHSLAHVLGVGRAGRGERGRVAARVQQLLGASSAADDRGDLRAGDDGGEFGPLRWQPAELAEPVEPGTQHAAVLPGVSGSPGVAGSHALRRVRLDPGRRAAVAIGICALVAALVSGWWVLSARPRSLALAGNLPSGSPLGSVTPGPSASAARSACPDVSGSSAASVVVDVSGKVHRPGVYTLRAGARVVDAVAAAGGALPGVPLTGLNLAARVTDGQQVPVGVPAAAPADPAATGAPSADAGDSDGARGSPVNLNTAGLDELQTLPGIGPVTAQHILDWRAQHGQFLSVDQLREVSGIGEVKFAELKPLVSV